MIALVTSWMAAALASLALWAFGWMGLAEVLATGVLALTALAALLIRAAAREMEMGRERPRGPLERGRGPRRRPFRAAARTRSVHPKRHESLAGGEVT